MNEILTARFSLSKHRYDCDDRVAYETERAFCDFGMKIGMGILNSNIPHQISISSHDENVIGVTGKAEPLRTITAKVEEIRVIDYQPEDDYSGFPWSKFTEGEIAVLMIESRLAGDFAFPRACIRELNKRGGNQ